MPGAGPDPSRRRGGGAFGRAGLRVPEQRWTRCSRGAAADLTASAGRARRHRTLSLRVQNPRDGTVTHSMRLELAPALQTSLRWWSRATPPTGRATNMSVKLACNGSRKESKRVKNRFENLYRLAEFRRRGKIRTSLRSLSAVARRSRSADWLRRVDRGFPTNEPTISSTDTTAYYATVKH